MPFSFIVSPVLLVSLTFVLVTAYGDIIEEKELIVNLSCPDLKEYKENQIFNSKLYFGSEIYLSYAEERYYNYC